MVSLEIIALVLTGLSITASIIYYSNVLSNSNKTQQLTLENRNAQLLMRIYDKYTETELMNQQIEIITQEWTDIDDFWDNYGPHSNPEFYAKFGRLAYFFDGLGVLVKRNLVEKDAIYDLMGVHILQYWNNNYGPIMPGLREKWNNPDGYKQFEYLVTEMKKLHNI